MEETKIVKRIIRKPESTEKPKTNNTDTFFKILNVAMFIMVLFIFLRGFNIKGTVRYESAVTQDKVNAMVTQMRGELENSRQIDKNEILSAFALYSRLDAASLKEREDYHKQQQSKYENMANQYRQGLTNLTNEIKKKKDSLK